MSFGAFSMNRQPFSPRFQALREWDTAVAVPEEPVTAVEFTIGLDLGKSQDYSALCIVQRTAPPQGEATYSVRHLHRWPLGTSTPRLRKTWPNTHTALGCVIPALPRMRPASAKQLWK